MLRLIRNLVRPYRSSLAMVLIAMLVETLMSLAAPWPLKVVLDNVVGGNRLPHWLSGLLGTLPGGGKSQIAWWAAAGVRRSWPNKLPLRQLPQFSTRLNLTSVSGSAAGATSFDVTAEV